MDVFKFCIKENFWSKFFKKRGLAKSGQPCFGGVEMVSHNVNGKVGIQNELGGII